MRIDPSPATSERPGVLSTLAHLLERLDRSGDGVDADQYRLVAKRLAQALAAEPPGAQLNAVLSAFPATAELYENLNYRYAGLCRSPLQSSLDAERRTVEMIRRLGGGANAAEPRAS